MPDHPRYVVTAASGQLGRLVVADLAARAGADAVAAVVGAAARGGWGVAGGGGTGPPPRPSLSRTLTCT